MHVAALVAHNLRVQARLFRSLALLALCSSGCVGRAYFTDGTSVSLGGPTRGVLRGGVALPTAGAGFVVPPLWIARGHLYGTEELVASIVDAAGRVATLHPGAVLGIGDLSRRGGGTMPFHKSHESGRDVDLIFYAVDDAGAPLPPVDTMPRYDRRLRSRPPYDGAAVPISPRHFDVRRNWSLVKALLQDPRIDVQYLFIAEKLKRHLMDHAVRQGEPEELLHRAEALLRQPARALPHDDHLHLRIRCSPGDRAQGCVDEGRVRLRRELIRRPVARLGWSAGALA